MVLFVVPVTTFLSILSSSSLCLPFHTASDMLLLLLFVPLLFSSASFSLSKTIPFELFHDKTTHSFFNYPFSLLLFHSCCHHHDTILSSRALLVWLAIL